jgi:hypothetical protein
MPAYLRGAVLGALVLLAGCNHGTRVVKVSGTLTRGGKPVPKLTIHFMPDAGGRPSWGLADENGRFTLEYDNTQKGALTGTHTVWVQWRPTSMQEEMNPKLANKPADLNAILDKYGDEKKTPLKIEITGATDNLEIKLD